MYKSILLVFVSLLMVACQTPPDIQQLQNQNVSLQGQLDQANNEITALKSKESKLNNELTERDRVMGILSQEKTSRVVTSTALRGQVRSFIQQQVDLLKGFLLAGDLLDYIGGELVERSMTDEEPLLIVDLANAMPKDGSLTSVGGFFERPGTMRVKLMRKVEDDLVVVWESNPLTITNKGLQKTNFSVSVGVQKGDVAAYYLSTAGMVGFDVGTGDSRYLKQDVSFGKAIGIFSLLGDKKKRAYSLGVYGLLDIQ